MFNPTEPPEVLVDPEDGDLAVGRVEQPEPQGKDPVEAKPVVEGDGEGEGEEDA